MSELFFLALGAFLGWNLPQPEFAKRFQVKVMTFFKGQ